MPNEENFFDIVWNFLSVTIPTMFMNKLFFEKFRKVRKKLNGTRLNKLFFAKIVIRYSGILKYFKGISDQ